MLIVKSALLYFALVFAAGFVLGTIRTLWVTPAIGARAAELAEAPIMVAISFIAARWLMARLQVPATQSLRLSIGVLAVVFMLLAEFTLVRWLRGLSFRQYMAARDPVSGTAYYLALAIFAAMPMLLARR